MASIAGLRQAKWDSPRPVPYALTRLLLIEDDEKLSRVLARGLTEDGYRVEIVSDGRSGLEALRSATFDLCLLDVELPGADGFEVLARARAEGITTPTLMLTARDAVRDRVRGLESGADDYLVKPFAFAELSARLRVISRRHGPQRGARLRARDLVADAKTRDVRRAGVPIKLTAKQFQLLEYLLLHRGEIVTRAMILSDVFGYAFDPGTNVVDVHVAHLRKRLDAPAPDASSLIETIRGVGYRIPDDP